MLYEFQPVKMMTPLFTVVLAAIFFASERNVLMLTAAIIAGLALIISHIRKHHLEFSKPLIFVLFGDLFFSFDLLISRVLLYYYSPLALYFLRCATITAVLFIIFRPKLAVLKRGYTFYFGSAIAYVASRVIIYYAFTSLGVVSTILVLTLAPLFIYILDYFVIREKIPVRSMAAGVVILVCVVVANAVG